MGGSGEWGAGDWTALFFLLICGTLGVLFSVVMFFEVRKVVVPDPETDPLWAQHVAGNSDQGLGPTVHEEHEDDALNGVSPNPYGVATTVPLDADEAPIDERAVLTQVASIQKAITEGAIAFLYAEYRIMGIFVVGFALLLLICLGTVEFSAGFFTALAFTLGALTSVISGYVGMRIAVYANARTTLQARRSIGDGFSVAFKAGAVMGFSLTAVGLLALLISSLFFQAFYYGSKEGATWEATRGLYEAIAGFGLGGSAIALFGRVGGGIYTKAADVGADLVGKVEAGIPEDDARNPATIADNVGDNVGDIAGMGSDLFGSFAEATCAALVIAAFSPDLAPAAVSGGRGSWHAMAFPFSITAAGLLVCIATSLLVTMVPGLRVVRSPEEVEPKLKQQLIVSTVAMTPMIFIMAKSFLPSEFNLSTAGELCDLSTGENCALYTSNGIFVCTAAGLWAGLFIGLITEYYTSNRYQPVRDVAESCKTGSATNIIYGLSLGYNSCVVPCFCLALTIFLSFKCGGLYGIACAALGMLSTLATGLTIDAYGPISDNAGGIAEMSGLPSVVRERTDALDAAGNTTAAIGKGFAIGSAGLVSLALFGAFVNRANVGTLDLMKPEVFSGLILGAMLPYWFSAMTMRSVGKAALAMVMEVRDQFRNNPGIMEGTVPPDYKRCVRISTDASLKEMIAPGVLVLLTPLVVGFFFGKYTLAGVLAGSLVSGVEMAISQANSGGGWDNAKKYIEAGASQHARSLGGKGSDCHAAAVTGDTVGDPMKDTSGPALNILIKLMAVESLVFGSFIASYGGVMPGFGSG